MRWLMFVHNVTHVYRCQSVEHLYVKVLTLTRSRYFTGSQCSSLTQVLYVRSCVTWRLGEQRSSVYAVIVQLAPEANLAVSRFHSPGEMLLVPGLESYRRHL